MAKQSELSHFLVVYNFGLLIMSVSLAFLGPYQFMIFQSVVQNWSNRCIAFLLKIAQNEQMCKNFKPLKKHQENFGSGFKNLQIKSM